MSNQIKLKRGTVREDGKIFWRYNKSAKNGEHWVTEDQIIGLKEKNRKRMRKYRKNNIEKVRASGRSTYHKTKENNFPVRENIEKLLDQKLTHTKKCVEKQIQLLNVVKI